MPAPIAWNRSPLPENRFAPLPLGAVCLEGDARERLRAERGGDDEERLCRAFLLADEGEQHEAVRRLKDKLEKEDGVRLASLRALMRLHGALNDASVAQALLETLKRYYDGMQDAPALGADSAALAADLTQTALWLYNLTGNKALLTLCSKLRAQGPDWTSLLHTFPQTRPVKELLTEEDPAYWRADGQTLAAALRACGLRALYEGGMKNETAFQAAWKKLSRYHGAAHGLFNAEPLLAGANPARGVLSNVTEELARSLETLQWTLGAPECGDAAERVFYNALCASGRRQQANQQEAAQGSGAFREQRMHALLTLILTHAYELCPEMFAAEDSSMLISIRSILDELDRHFMEELSLMELASRYHVSLGCLTRHFREAVGMSPMQYITRSRLTLAKQLLMDTGKPIAEVAAACGYRDASNFIRRFKAQFGCSPLQFRRANRHDARIHMRPGPPEE